MKFLSVLALVMGLMSSDAFAAACNSGAQSCVFGGGSFHSMSCIIGAWHNNDNALNCSACNSNIPSGTGNGATCSAGVANSKSKQSGPVGIKPNH